jgi:hypothetical protein
MAPISPTVAQWELNSRLRQRRKDLGMPVKTITDTMEFTRNYWSIVENDRRILSEPQLAKVIELFEFDRDEGNDLMRLRAIAKGRGWWDRYSGLLNDDVVRLFGMEHGASATRAYECSLITGLLQTEGYARAHLAASVFVREADIDQLVEVLLTRQHRLEGDDPLELTVLLAEAVLLQQPGGPETQRNQLKHLATMIETHPNIDVRVLPFTSGGRGILGSSTFTLMDFPSRHLHTLAWFELVTYWGFLDDANQVRDFSVIYGQAYDEALSQEDSLNRIQQAASEIQ